MLIAMDCVRKKTVRLAITVSVGFGSLMAGGPLACVDASAPSLSAPSPTDLAGKLFVTPDALVMAKGDRAPVTVTAQDLRGEPMSMDGDEPVVWTSSDTARVVVEADGRIYAKAATNPDDFVNLTGTWTHNAVTRSVTVLVNVTPTRYPIQKIKLIPKDSVRTSWSNITSSLVSLAWINVAAIGPTDADTLPRLRFPVYSLNGRAQVLYLGALGILTGGTPYAIQSRGLVGDYWLYTQSSVYGVMMRDSAKFTALYAFNAKISFMLDSATNSITSRYVNEEVIVQPCGEVNFDNQLTTPIDIVFDDPGKASGCVAGNPTGNIEAIGPKQMIGRKFRAPGRVRWTVRDRTTGQLVPYATGTILMKEP